jgi:hypothetical protein
MRKHLLLLATVSIFAACAEKEQINETREVAIDFTKSYIEKGSKAIHTGLYTTNNFEAAGNTMGVYGWKKKSTTYTPIFDNQEVEYGNAQLAANDWAYTPKKYWDSDADNYAFYAYAPHSSDFPNGGTVAMTTAGNGNTFSITNFTQAAVVDNQIDLMVDLTSQIENTTNKAATKTDVAFTFSHILTQVNFKMGVSANLKADNTNNPVTVQSITLNNVNIKGSYAYSSAWAWSGQATPTTFNATQSSNVVFASDVLTSTAVNIPGLVNMLLIPGSVTGYTVTVNYTIGTTNPESFTKTINLTDFKNSSSQSLSTWAIGYNYTYILTIGPEPIEFDLHEVGGWTTGDTYEYTIE